MIELIGLDADDTLWHNEHLYLQAKKKFAQVMAKYSSSQQARLHLDETEVGNIDFYGYGIKSFALSMIETAIEVSRGQVEGQLIAELIAVAKEMLSAEVELVEGVHETLARLSPNYDLMLITKGDLYEQERKIDRSGIAPYFRYHEVVGEKSEANYLKILRQYNLDPKGFLMVGNSIRSDILPVLRIGGQAVYIHNDQTWFHENAGDEEIGELQFTELEQIDHLPNFLAQINNDPGF